MKLNQTLAAVLGPAYRCPAFDTSCTDRRWDPPEGHVPIGFAGALGSLSEVELVLVVAEPGDPHGEPHTGLRSAYDHAMDCFRAGRDPFHQNVMRILELCWPGPGVSFDDRWRKTWLTESVLCAAEVQGGRAPSRVVQECGARYLRPQLSLLSQALVVALGAAARERLVSLGIVGFAEADHPSTRRFPQSLESWKRIPQALRRHRQGLPPIPSNAIKAAPVSPALVRDSAATPRSPDRRSHVPPQPPVHGTVLVKVEWVRRAGLPTEEVIRVHYMRIDPSDPVTLCGLLHTTASRYLNEGHVVRRTTRAVTCGNCLRSAAKFRLR